MNIAIIGCGEVGQAYALAADKAGHQLVLIDPRPKASALSVAASTGSVIHPAVDHVLTDVERVWICVSGDLASTVIESLASVLSSGATVVDMTTASPQDKRDGAEILAAQQCQYVDAAIMGSVSLTGARTPLLLSGDTAPEIADEFAEVGAPVQVLPNSRAGDAVAVKLLRTILTKGLESLAVECFMAAETQGLRQSLYDVLGDFDTVGFVPFLEMLVTSHVQHANRRMHEVERARTQLAEMGTPSLVLEGTEARLAHTARALSNDDSSTLVPGDVASTIEWLLRTNITETAVR